MTEAIADGKDITASITPRDIASQRCLFGLGHMARLAIYLKISELLQEQFKVKNSEFFGWSDIRAIFCHPAGFIYVPVNDGMAVEVRFCGAQITIKGGPGPVMAMRAKIKKFIDLIDIDPILEQAREHLEGQNLADFDRWMAGRYVASLKLAKTA